MMNKRNKAANGLVRAAAMSVPLLALASIHLPPKYLWVSLAVDCAILGVSSAVYCAVSGLMVSPLDAARLATQLRTILLLNPGLYINMANHEQFARGITWLIANSGGGGFRDCELPFVNSRTILDAARLATQLRTILLVNPELYINMADSEQFARGVTWLIANSGGGGVRDPELSFVNSRIEQVFNSKIKPVVVNPIYAACVAEEIVHIMFLDPESYIEIPYRSQFVRGLLWLANPEVRGLRDLELPFVNPKIEPVD